MIAYETGVTAEPDPLGGSEFLERLTDKIEAEALDYIRRIDEMGGMVRRSIAASRSRRSHKRATTTSARSRRARA